MKAALIQPDIFWEDQKANYGKAASFAARAAAEHCDIIVFPEMFNTGFSMNLAAVADEGLGETTSILSAIAAENSINLIAGFPIKSPAEDRGRNMAFVYDRKGMMVSTYTKMHPFCLSDEEKYFIAGDHTAVFDIDCVPSSVFICYDLRFPEIFRSVARRVKQIFVIANWPSTRAEHWDALLKARAIENQCFIIGVNRTGTDGNGIAYSGESCVFDPMGNPICKGDENKELVVCEFDPSKTDKVRAEYPFLADMRHLHDKEEWIR
ncbi:MAG TPA: carbon-nitrogen family hydrolase [Dissulfurispiraceae bacterium]|nr:carbon-nitrogen family hydrolase [Dissulfurispiraceae bacterium]